MPNAPKPDVTSQTIILKEQMYYLGRQKGRNVDFQPDPDGGFTVQLYPGKGPVGTSEQEILDSQDLGKLAFEKIEEAA
jgi:hypothetical protein